MIAVKTLITGALLLLLLPTDALAQERGGRAGAREGREGREAGEAREEAPAQIGVGGDPAERWDFLRKKYDKDGDGRVARGEYDRGEEAFGRLDRNGDGALTLADFQREDPRARERAERMAPMLLRRGLGASPREGLSRRHVESRFTALDKDEDGLLSRAEWEQGAATGGPGAGRGRGGPGEAGGRPERGGERGGERGAERGGEGRGGERPEARGGERGGRPEGGRAGRGEGRPGRGGAEGDGPPDAFGSLLTVADENHDGHLGRGELLGWFDRLDEDRDGVWPARGRGERGGFGGRDGREGRGDRGRDGREGRGDLPGADTPAAEAEAEAEDRVADQGDTSDSSSDDSDDGSDDDGSGDGDDADSPTARGRLAPDFRLEPLHGGAPVSLSAFRGDKPVALVFGSYT